MRTACGWSRRRCSVDKCTCSDEKLLATLRQMPRDEIETLAEADGAITADCQFCGRLYRFAVDKI